MCVDVCGCVSVRVCVCVCVCVCVYVCVVRVGENQSNLRNGFGTTIPETANPWTTTWWGQLSLGQLATWGRGQLPGGGTTTPGTTIP